MMLEALYTLLVVTGSTSCALAATALGIRVWLVAKKKATLRSQAPHILAKAGYLMVVGVVVQATIAAGEVAAGTKVTPQLVLFIVGYIVGALGFMSMSLDSAAELSRDLDD